MMSRVKRIDDKMRPIGEVVWVDVNAPNGPKRVAVAVFVGEASEIDEAESEAVTIGVDKTLNPKDMEAALWQALEYFMNATTPPEIKQAIKEAVDAHVSSKVKGVGQDGLH